MLKDARFVSLIPYINGSQILQYVKYTKWINIAKGIAKFNFMLIMLQIVKLQQQKHKKQQKQNEHKTLARAGNRTWELFHRSMEGYL